MGTVFLQGDPPYELLATRAGTAIAQGESVRLTLPVFVPGLPQQEQEIELVLRFGHAFRLSSLLREAAIEARKQAKEGDE
jgi:hypothetical protein